MIIVQRYNVCGIHLTGHGNITGSAQASSVGVRGFKNLKVDKNGTNYSAGTQFLWTGNATVPGHATSVRWHLG